MKTICGIAVLSCLIIGGAAHADCMKGNAGIPPGANTTDPSAPFYVDISGLDLKTLPPTRDAGGQDLFLHLVVERQHGLQSRYDPR